MTLILGGSSSGKSEFAENLLYNSNKKIYIATMMPFGSESLLRIKKHEKARENKNFSTLECFYNLHNLEVENNSNVLLECIGNLVANEMFSKNDEKSVSDIVEGVLKVNSKCDNMVIVSNDVFLDGVTYDDETMKYIKKLADVNKEIAKNCNNVIEIVCGIPNVLKGGDL